MYLAFNVAKTGTQCVLDQRQGSWVALSIPDFSMYLFLAPNGQGIPLFGRCPKNKLKLTPVTPRKKTGLDNVETNIKAAHTRASMDSRELLYVCGRDPHSSSSSSGPYYINIV